MSTMREKAKTLYDLSSEIQEIARKLLYPEIRKEMQEKWVRLEDAEQENRNIKYEFSRLSDLEIVTNQKNIKLEAEIQKLKEQLNDRKLWSREKGIALARCDHAYRDLEKKLDGICELFKVLGELPIKSLHGTYIIDIESYEKFKRKLEEMLR